jgi:hypothetical protein
VINSLWPWVVESSATCTKMKAAKKANEDPGKKLIPTQKRRTFTRTKKKIIRNTDKAEEAKVEPVVEKAKEAPVVDGIKERKILRDTIKIEQDKIAEIKRRDLEGWRQEELIKPIQERLDRRQKELDQLGPFNEDSTFKGGGKMKPIKKK